ncbi:type I 3-dehydroquinate dehydratase [Methanosalsum natronophilum]|uniref:3-dehydroquinate dehydratase n=1 Tax=Methanosalsum natronophilum TaxID=768733 RepID=A0A424Z144_9EURY|nr:type I 3-dehydroquinate dehydratase [Methanosalsum natronophilum]MCS3923552.1 3-dehydroquinate dehydratase-1 [Methanosalsum natronophilum]RQD87862.1 MAG: type I 3-dehydroquinate dehydratase [Methanosalsum natronophilum]
MDKGHVKYPLIIASISDNVLDQAICAKKMGATALEFRIDLMEPYSVEELMKLITSIKDKTELTCIATNRSSIEGGSWKGSENERLSILSSISSRVDYIDLELSTDEQVLVEVIKEIKKNKSKVILSYHNFESTPPNSDLQHLINRSATLRADITKIAVMPLGKEDVIRLLQVTLNTEHKICAISMGEIGKHSRIIAPIYGSVLTYGYVNNPTAPGQVRIDKLKEIIEWIT